MDLWTQLEFLGKGLSGFETFAGFKASFGKWKTIDVGARGVEKLTGLRNVPLLQERLVRLTFAITKKEAGLRLPDKVHDFHEVEMTAHQRDMYERVKSELLVEMQDKLTGDVDALAVHHILTRLLRLQQVTGGHITWDPVVDEEGNVVRAKRVERIVKPNPKVEAVVEMLEDPDRDPLAKTIVWCHFVPEIELLSEVLEARGHQHVTYYGAISHKIRERREESFNHDPATRVMVCNAQTAGEGLNLLGYDWEEKSPQLDTYVDHAIFFSCNWSALDRKQAEDRSHRRGMKMPVRYTDLVVPSTIDDQIRAKVRLKKEMADETLNIESVLREVLA
jgi:SNF2 family DNA or RNA helicase